MINYLLGFITVKNDYISHAFYGLLVFNLANIFTSVGCSLLLVVILSIGKEVYDNLYNNMHAVNENYVLATTCIPVVLVVLNIILGEVK